MLKPLADRVLIKPDEAATMTESGIHLVPTHAPEYSGTVVAIPERCSTHCPECGGAVFHVPSVQVGDTVLFGADAGQEIWIDAERYLLIRDTDLSAVLVTA